MFYRLTRFLYYKLGIRAFRYKEHFSTDDCPYQAVQRWCFSYADKEPDPFFVIVGSNDGVTLDRFSMILVNDYRWKGAFIEPVPYCLKRLKENIPPREGRYGFYQLAISSSNGSRDFFYVDDSAEGFEDLPIWCDQIGSFDREHVAKHLDASFQRHIVSRKVKTLTLKDFFIQNDISEVSFLLIDVEGFDFEVLKSNDFSEVSPEVIVLEHKHCSKEEKREVRSFLESHQYKVKDCGEDFFAQLSK